MMDYCYCYKYKYKVWTTTTTIANKNRCSVWRIRFVPCRHGLNLCCVIPTYKTVITASMFGAQHQKSSVEKKRQVRLFCPWIMEFFHFLAADRKRGQTAYMSP